MKYFFKLARFPNLLMMALTQAIVVASAFPNIETYNTVLIIIFTMCIAAAGYIENDIFDVEIDNINKPESVIVGKEITEKKAWFSIAILQVIALLIALYFFVFFQNKNVLYAYFSTSILLFLYAKWLKKSFLIGNIIVAFLCAFTIGILVLCRELFFLNDIQVKNTDFLMNFAFLITFFREIVKDMEDKDGDAKFGAWTMPIVAGNLVSKIVAILALSWLLFQVFILSAGVDTHTGNEVLFSKYYALLFLELPLLVLIIQLLRAKFKTQFHSISTVAKIIMLFGLGYFFIF
jgi:4-hydroxybenzoate polyprenyltransferase